ncbi:GNAT family N-acetyltransferase [Calothrix sp. PCC 6303]|uniref:GNAT family N-acetyltransferase n=1 Tax=Calothrix sp. PCC 6303 TaxID=1170562 RepID=UPI0002A03BA3|nr:N-acetyltransferase [Calothrix sp. PCC 6303]AFZ02654.1 GCN5-related N-acetyltransferase [Calothrix sp. PCC 6303]
MKIRVENYQDYLRISEVNTLAFARENEANLITEVRNSNFYIPELSLVAEIDDIVVAHIMFSYIELIGEERLRVLSLAPVAVIPEFQKQGIGSNLIKAGLEKADAMGEALAIVLGSPSFYNRFGFMSSAIYDIKCPFDVPEDVFMVKIFKNFQVKYQGEVVYPPAFSRV